MRSKVSGIVFAALAVLSLSVGAAAASSQEENEIKKPTELYLMVNPFTAMRYCFPGGTGCLVQG
jgi:hypothetical protein